MRLPGVRTCCLRRPERPCVTRAQIGPENGGRYDRQGRHEPPDCAASKAHRRWASEEVPRSLRRAVEDHRHVVERLQLLRAPRKGEGMSHSRAGASLLRCAIYTRKSTTEGLDSDFNTLDAQREASEHYIQSQAHLGWRVLDCRYDDGGFTGGNLDRPALRRLLEDSARGEGDVVVC